MVYHTSNMCSYFNILIAMEARCTNEEENNTISVRIPSAGIYGSHPMSKCSCEYCSRHKDRLVVIEVEKPLLEVKMISNDFKQRLESVRKGGDIDWVDVLLNMRNKQSNKQVHLMMTNSLIFKKGVPDILVGVRKRGIRRGELYFNQSNKIQFTHLWNLVMNEYQHVNPCPMKPSKFVPSPKIILTRFTKGDISPKKSKQDLPGSPKYNMNQGVYDKEKELSKEERILRHWHNHDNIDSNLVIDYPSFKMIMASKDHLSEFPRIISNLDQEARSKFESIFEKMGTTDLPISSIMRLSLIHHHTDLHNIKPSDPFIVDPMGTLKQYSYREAFALCKQSSGNPIWQSISCIQIPPLSFNKSNQMSVLFDSNFILQRDLFTLASLEPLHITGKNPSYSFKTEYEAIRNLPPYMYMVFVSYKVFHCILMFSRVCMRRFRADFMDDGFGNIWLCYVSTIEKIELLPEVRRDVQDNSGGVDPGTRVRGGDEGFEKSKIKLAKVSMEDTAIREKMKEIEEKDARLKELKMRAKQAYNKEKDREGEENKRVKWIRGLELESGGDAEERKSKVKWGSLIGNIEFKDSDDPRHNVKFIEGLKNHIEKAGTIKNIRSSSVDEQRKKKERILKIEHQMQKMVVARTPTLLETSMGRKAYKSREKSIIEPTNMNKSFLVRRSRQSREDTPKRKDNMKNNNEIDRSLDKCIVKVSPIAYKVPKKLLKMAYNFLNKRLLLKGDGRLASDMTDDKREKIKQVQELIKNEGNVEIKEDKVVINVLPFEAQINAYSEKRKVIFGLTTKLDGKVFKIDNDEIKFS